VNTLVAPPEIRGERVVIRPLRMHDVEPLLRGMAGDDTAGMPLRPPARADLVRRVEAGGRMDQYGNLDLAIEVDGRLAGDVQARQPRMGLPPGVFEIGITILDPADRGRGVGREALALLTTFLFANGAHRVQCSTDVANAPMRALCERLGYRLEGVLRAFMPARQGLRDYALYAVAKEEWNGGGREGGTAEPLVLRGDGVTLRPYRPEEADEFVRLAHEPDGGSGIGGEGTSFAWPMGPPPEEALRARVPRSGRLVGGLVELAIEADGRVVGGIQARNTAPCFPPAVYMIGINMLARARGRGLGRKAVRLLATYLFDRLGAERVEMPTDVENVPMRTVAERLGFTFEGVARSLFDMGGVRRDYAQYAMTRDDWEAVKERWTSAS
jgi:[ribosomal protein S5]-alanine N-acetyltransferase